MKNGLLRFYLVFMAITLVLFSCENNDLTQNNGRSSQNAIERRPDGRIPIEPNGAPVDGQKSKKIPRRIYSRSSTLC